MYEMATFRTCGFRERRLTGAILAGLGPARPAFSEYRVTRPEYHLAAVQQLVHNLFGMEGVVPATESVVT